MGSNQELMKVASLMQKEIDRKEAEEQRYQQQLIRQGMEAAGMLPSEKMVNKKSARRLRRNAARQ